MSTLSRQSPIIGVCCVSSLTQRKCLTTNSSAKHTAYKLAAVRLTRVGRLQTSRLRQKFLTFYSSAEQADMKGGAEAPQFAEQRLSGISRSQAKSEVSSSTSREASAKPDIKGNTVALCTIRVHSKITSPPLQIWFKDEQTGALSEQADTSRWDAQPWDRSLTGDKEGTIFSGRLSLGSVTHPGAVLIAYVGPQEKNAKKKAAQLSRVYVADVKVSLPGSQKVAFSVHSFVNAIHTELYGHRIFFKEDALLPKDTPQALMADRQLDMDIVKGLDKTGRKIANDTRLPADRIEDYAVYNDLGNKKAARPVLGDPKIDGFSYPRRLRTNRGLNSDEKTEVASSGDIWVPADDDFDETKEGSFSTSATLAVIPLLIEQLTRGAARTKPSGIATVIPSLISKVVNFVKSPTKSISSGSIGGSWKSYDEMVQIYDNRQPSIVIQAKITGDSSDESDEQTREMLSGLSSKERLTVFRWAGISEEDFEAPEKVVPSMRQKFKDLRQSLNDKLDWAEPLVYRGQHTPKNTTDYDGNARHDSWASDAEFGRQYKAGINPLVLSALKALPTNNSTLQDNQALIERSMEGNTIEELMSQVRSGAPPRIFMVDYETYLEEWAHKVNVLGEDRCLYAGRCIMYQKDDMRLVPVAIEMHAPETSASQLVLYTPYDPPQVWQLAKTAFNNIDSTYHQLVSHWLRTHCAVEPYIIATDRNLSQLHPVYKILQPHLQYTYRINADARKVLVAANTVIELLFTTSSESMQLSSRVYNDWKFTDQAFPQDVINRGLARPVEGGGLEIIAEDYPYCEDGLLIWDALSTYMSDYIAVYYKSDDDVKSDVELNSWWSEIKDKGHADADPSGWPRLETAADLAHILATIAWTASAHHAAVNFGQVDYGSFVLNRSCLLRKPIPEKGSSAYQALTDPKTSEEEFMTYVANQLPACINIAVLQILATHSDNENYLSDSKQKYISGEAALAVHTQLLKDLDAAERTIEERNTSGQSKARTVSEGGLPYQLLIPSGTDSEGKPLSSNSTGKRVSNRPGRGIPFSISI